jgi:hypothetical protein
MPTVQQFVKVIEKQLLSTGIAKLKSVNNDMFAEIADAISKKYIVKVDYDKKEIELVQHDKENEEEEVVDDEEDEEVEVDVENNNEVVGTKNLNEKVDDNQHNDKVNDNKQEKESNKKENVDVNVHNDNEVVKNEDNNTTLQGNTQNLNIDVHNNEYSDKMSMIEDEKADERAMIILKREYSEPLKKKYNTDSLTTVIKTMIKNELKQMGIEYQEESKKRFTKVDIVKIGDLL